MSHYRTIQIDDKMFRYVVGTHQTKIDRVYSLNGAGLFGNAVESYSSVGVFSNEVIGRGIGDHKTIVSPSDIEKVIRRELNIPQREYYWDKAITKTDPGPRTRGFRALLGKRIIDIRVSAINEVILEDEDACRYAIETEAGPLGIGVIKLRVLAGDETED